MKPFIMKYEGKDIAVTEEYIRIWMQKAELADNYLSIKICVECEARYVENYCCLSCGTDYPDQEEE